MRIILQLLFCSVITCTFAQKYNGLIPYRKDSLWGYADVSGKLVVPAQFKVAGPYGDDGLAKVQTSKGYQLIDGKGKLLPAVYGELGLASEGLRMAANEDKKFGYVDAKGNWVIKPAYKSISALKNGTATVKLGSNEGFVTRNDQLTIDSGWVKASRIDESNYFVVRSQGAGKWSRGGNVTFIMNKSGRVIKKLENYAAVNGYLGFEHLLVLETKYSNTERDFGYMIIDTGGNYVSLLKAPYKSGRYLMAETKEGWGILDNKGEWKMNPVKGLNPVSFKYGYAVFRSGNNYMIIDSTGKEVAKNYGYISSRTQVPGLFSGKKTGQAFYEIIDTKGNVLDTCNSCITMEPLPGDLSLVNMDSKNYVRAKGGKIMLPAADYISYSKDGYTLINYGKDSAGKKNYSVTYYGFYSPELKQIVPMEYSTAHASFIPGYLYLTDLNKKPLGYMHMPTGKKFWVD